MMEGKMKVGDLAVGPNNMVMVVEEEYLLGMTPKIWVCAWIVGGKLNRRPFRETELIKIVLAAPEVKLHWDHENTIGIEEYDELKALNNKIEDKLVTMLALKAIK
jgi:hypothetical protein